MNQLREAVRQFRIDYMLKAVVETKGNFCAAAAVCGVHRNTFTRQLHAAGYTSQVVKQALKRKGPLSVEVEILRDRSVA